ncbi:MAG: GTPase [Planctomycetota bacterium]|nr:MAG: GTPase [Planctomycetota bacterium]
MVQINFARKEVNCKIVYYGCGLSGKTTNLEVVHEKAPSDRKGELTSIATEGDRTLFFDFMPLDLGKVGGMSTKFQLYTVPGQVYYNATRKLVLQGADGVVFVADSQRSKLEENIESLKNLEENLRENGLDIRKIPLVIQYNKRDLPDAMPVEELDEKLNWYGCPTFEAVAIRGEGVFPTLKKLSAMVLAKLNKEYGVGSRKPARTESRAQAAKASSGEISTSDRPAPTRKPAAKLQRQSALETATATAAPPATERRKGAAQTERPARSEPARPPRRSPPPPRERDPLRTAARRRTPPPPPARSPETRRSGSGNAVFYAIYALLALVVIGVVYLLVSGKLNEWIANL